MSLQGWLEDMSLLDILQIIALSKRSGILTLILKEGTGRLVFHQGRVTFASSDSRGRLGYTLVQKGIVTNEALEQALRIQKGRGSKKPIGTILIEAGAIDNQTLESELRIHIVAVVSDFLSSSSGSFYFELGTIPDMEAALSTGFGTESLVLEALRYKDEEERSMPIDILKIPPIKKSVPAKPANPFKSPLPAVTGSDPETAGVTRPGFATSTLGGPRERLDLNLLPAMIAELSRSDASNELTLMILRFANEIMNRVVIFLVREDDIVGLGQFGLHLPDVSEQEQMKSIRIPLEDPSVFKNVVEQKVSYKGSLPETERHRYLVDQLGKEWPFEVFVAPLIYADRVIAVLYGDNLPDREAVGETEGLEAFIKVAEVKFAKTLLERKSQDSSAGGP